MQFHQADGHTGEVLREPDSGLGDDNGGERAARTHGLGRRATGTDGEHGGDHESHQHHRSVGMQLRDSGDVEPESPGLGRVPAVRTGAGGHRAEDQHRARDQGEHPGEPEQLGPGHREDRASALTGPAVEHDDVHQQQHRQQEMPGHQRGVQLEQDGQPTEHHLAEEAEPEAERERDEVAAALGQPQRYQRQQQHHQPHGDGQQTIAEFDPAVRGILRPGDERVVTAGGPGGAAKPGPGQPHRAAGDDNQREQGDGNPGEEAEDSGAHRRYFLPSAHRRSYYRS